jgi:hypothetical protein
MTIALAAAAKNTKSVAENRPDRQTEGQAPDRQRDRHLVWAPCLVSGSKMPVARGQRPEAKSIAKSQWEA